MKPKPPSEAQDTFSGLLVHHGFAHNVANALATKPILKKGDTRENGRKRLMEYFDNYYMQFMALQLERYGFQLNRPLITAAELNHAAGIIGGKHGNPPLDTSHLIALLTETVDALMSAQDASLITWNQFFHATHIASDGSIIRGQDIIKGMIKTNLMHNGASIENYSHNFRGRVFITLSMMQAVEQQLIELSLKGFPTINRFGQPVSTLTIGEARKFALHALKLSDPKFADYLSLSAHGRIKDCIERITTNLNQKTPDLAILDSQRQELARDCFNLGIYSKAWREYLLKMNDYMLLIATPYA